MGLFYSRKSKLSFAKTVSILLAMQGKTISEELRNFFDYKLNTSSASEVHETYKGFRLLAVYDIQNKIYVDSIVESVNVCDEQSALTQMIDRSEIFILCYTLKNF